ncbi:MAG: hypothetical protein KatS3mg003_0641 [Candidatus Nitrosocaldaceae archaeon]|nr:MAG: hypothetical protein KatS3mg003_0641 [Candidatus Nitrosocaldaceae archaeon]
MLAELELHKIKVLGNNKVLDIERIDSISYSLLDIINDIANDPISRYEALNLLLSIIKDRANNYINSNVYNYSDEHANARLAWDRADKVGEEMYEQKINRHNSIPKVTKKSTIIKGPKYC